MAEKDTYPMLAAKSWWALRDKLHKSPNVKVTASFLASLLGMQERSAKINALNYFKQIKLIDDEGNPTDLAMKWRNDDTYPEACNEIRQSCYPKELIDLFPNPDADLEAIKKWFRNSTRIGEDAANKQSRFYLLLTEADPSKVTDAPKRSTNGAVQKAQTKPVDKPTAPKQPEPPIQDSPPQPPAPRISTHPSLHIDVQIHISPDTSAEQIERIFASMAKHFQNMKGNTTE